VNLKVLAANDLAGHGNRFVVDSCGSYKGQTVDMDMVMVMVGSVEPTMMVLHLEALA
jgi:hypothetical protein